MVVLVVVVERNAGDVVENVKTNASQVVPECVIRRDDFPQPIPHGDLRRRPTSKGMVSQA